MRVITRRKLLEFCERHPGTEDVREPLDAFFRTAERADWRKHADLKALYSSADVVGKYTVLNVGGNKYRLILEIFYDNAVILIRHVLTHEEYDRNLWCRDAYKPTPVRKKSVPPKAAPKKGR